jgi:hypothetical protein
MRNTPASCGSVFVAALAAALAAFAAEPQSGPPGAELTLDASRVVGRIRPLQDLASGPLCQRGIVDLSPYYKQLGVRNVRLHDIPWAYDNTIDINYVFPRWNADPDVAGNYDFTQSDFYIRTLTGLGINVIYRLGYSAEYKTAVRHSAPPDSYSKWADVCTRIVRHYNQGWADGARLGIKYWEVWNEPDGHGLVFWSGTPEEFYRLYETTARALKALDPTLKVGGPGLAGDLDFLEGLLRYCRDHNVPLDFASWHCYTDDAHWVARQAGRVHDLLVRYGFPHAESILDEWNLGPADWNVLFKDPGPTRAYFDAMQNSYGAAFNATVLTELQDVPLEIATSYSGTTFMWGLFTSSGAPQKAYYAFLAFRRLLDSPDRLALARPSSPDLSALAGISEDRKQIRILLANLGPKNAAFTLHLENLPWQGASRFARQAVNAHSDLQTAESGQVPGPHPTLHLEVDGPGVSLITLEAPRP